jgi:hypothetical protein
VRAGGGGEVSVGAASELLTGAKTEGETVGVQQSCG